MLKHESRIWFETLYQRVNLSLYAESLIKYNSIVEIELYFVLSFYNIFKL